MNCPICLKGKIIKVESPDSPDICHICDNCVHEFFINEDGILDICEKRNLTSRST